MTHTVAVPQAPDYADASQWFTSLKHADVDLFYIISTETEDFALADGTVQHHADTYADSRRQLMAAEMEYVDVLLGGGLNFFTPYYRQCSLQSFVSESLVESRADVAKGDVKRAFGYYLEHLNQGRPFILMGYSQGAFCAVDLLRGMDDAVYRRMVAAYVVGWKLTDGDLAAASHIVPARASDDLGVTVCYNSVRTAQAENPMISRGNRVAINPVNWRTDAEPAVVLTEPSPFLPLDRQPKDTLTVRLDPDTRLLMVDGYSGTGYVLPLIGQEGNYHALEVWLYRESLHRNMLLRADAFMRR